MIEVLLIAIAICIDSFALGVTYGVKKIIIPKVCIFIISLFTAFILGISAFFGQLVRQFISPHTASFISCILLVSLGAFFMLEGYIKYLRTLSQSKEKKGKLAKIRIPKLGIIIDIALDVTRADMDISGDISIKEAMYIGFILSIDSFGAGFGYAVGGDAIWFLLLTVLVINVVSLSYGLFLGKKVTQPKADLKTSLLPGIILMFIGIMRWVW